MNKKNKIIVFLSILCCLTVNASISKEVVYKDYKYPDYSYEFLGEDKYENINRKIFTFNGALNKYAIRPVHIIWASIMPKYGMDRIKNVYNNIEYPKRLVSCLIQKDFKATKNETIRFLTNSTVGLGGMFDPASRYLKIEQVQEDMDQAFAKCKIKPGPYIVLPVLASTSPRGIAGRIVEAALDPSLYFASPFTALVKLGLVVNKTAYMQPLSEMIETTYADPYEIMKKLYALECYIKNCNLDRKENLELVMETPNNRYNIEEEIAKDNLVKNNEDETKITKKGLFPIENSLFKKHKSNDETTITKLDSETPVNEVIEGRATYLDKVIKENLENLILKADIVLENYNPQTPVIDSMRTALFELPGINDSIWSEMSIWNRSFSEKIKTSSVQIHEGREKYDYRYILQKDKSSPIAILYPSIGEGVNTHHSVVMAKLFYDQGYSVVIQGSHFHFAFVNSMPKEYKPGIPTIDAKYLQLATKKIIENLQEKHKCVFGDKVLVGTSFGAMTTLFIASDEYKNDTLGIKKYISINPPIELLYAIKELDKNNDVCKKNNEDIRHSVSVTAAKVLHLYKMKEETPYSVIEKLPFTDEEAKLITGFILRQKLSDLVFTLENASINCKSDIYESINNMSYEDYAQKYLLGKEYKKFNDLNKITSLHYIADYLIKDDKYKIYHTLDDYFVNKEQLKQLKQYCGNKLVLVSNGGHLGFLYRHEFINELKKDIKLGEKLVLNPQLTNAK